jgi:quercetin dioxygenase-like cupin family protein
MRLISSFIPTPIAAAALAAGIAFLGAGFAQAGECPKEHVLAKPREIAEIPDAGVRRETLAVVHLKNWRGVGDLWLRTRKLTIAPNAMVPTHGHDDRPSIVFMLKGELWEHSSHCGVPIQHREGEWSAESGEGRSHWWENRTNQEVIVLSSDVIPPEGFDPGTENLKNDM